ncbi:hypothetical protein VPH35_107517 [Triticum aestivum]
MTTPSSHFHSQLLLLLSVILLVILAAAAEEQQHLGCPDMCGNISIPFPFGMGKAGCFREGFQVLCNYSFVPPRAFLADTRTFMKMEYHTSWLREAKNLTSWELNHTALWSLLELVSISLATGEARAYAPVAYICRPSDYNLSGYTPGWSKSQVMNFSNSPFAVSVARNVLIGVGMRVQAFLGASVPVEFKGRAAWTERSYCSAAQTTSRTGMLRDGPCTTGGCCEVPVDDSSTSYGRSAFKDFLLSAEDEGPNIWWKPICNYGMLVERSWYNFYTTDLEGTELLKRFPRGVPLALDFAAGNAYCPAEGQPLPPNYACVSDSSSCANATYSPGYICKCRDNYIGNPYVAHGCQDIDECKQPELYHAQVAGSAKTGPEATTVHANSGRKATAKRGAAQMYSLQ